MAGNESLPARVAVARLIWYDHTLQRKQKPSHRTLCLEEMATNLAVQALDVCLMAMI
jgi:hypothetical protein